MEEIKDLLFPEIWVVANILLALISRSVVQNSTERWITIILCIYAIERTFEMLVYQIKSATRTVILLIFNMIEYILQFSVIFSALGSLLQNQQMHLNTFDSFLIFMNLDDLNRFSGNFVMNIAFYETLIGLFMNILCIGYFIGMLPQNNNINNNDNDKK